MVKKKVKVKTKNFSFLWFLIGAFLIGVISKMYSLTTLEGILMIIILVLLWEIDNLRR